MFLEDYRPGTTRTLGSITVSEDEIIAFATQFDPQPMHVDVDAATHGPFGGLIASGWHTCALTMRVLVDEYFSAESSLVSPGVDEVRWLSPVRAGDVLSVKVTVLDNRRSTRKPDRGTVRTAIETVNQNGVTVLGLTAINLIRARGEGV